MKCPVCKGDARVADSRELDRGNERRRRYHCLDGACSHRWTTREARDLVPLRRFAALEQHLARLRAELDAFDAQVRALLADGDAE